MNWSILGIAPTKDKKAITAAYRAKLKVTNPEDKPEEFKALRAAYEEALHLCAQEDPFPVRDESPVGLWMEKVKAVYFDFPARIQPGSWQRLLSSDVCVGLDTRSAAEEALLRFLMENFFLPQDIWKLLDNVFDFSGRSDELCEAYPQDFIYLVVLEGIRSAPLMDFDLFTPGVDAAQCDQLQHLYRQALRMPMEEMEEILDQMEALSESHPYCRSKRCHWLRHNGREEEGAAGLRALAEAYPQDAGLNLEWANACLDRNDMHSAKLAAQRVLSIEPGQIHATLALADCLAEEGELDEAKELLYDVIHASGDDPMMVEDLSQRLQKLNEELILRREETYRADPGDSHNAIELAWCYIQNERMDDALEVARTIDADCDDQYAYHNLMGKLYFNSQQIDKALPHLEKTEEILRGMAPDGTRETDKRLRRYPEMLQILGTCLMELGRQDQAQEKFAQALAIAPENPSVLTIMAKILFSTGAYERCEEILQQLLRLSPTSWLGNVMLSMSLYRLHRDRDAFDAINRALNIQGGDLGLYVMKMQILLRNGVFDEVRAILNMLEEAGAPEDVSLDWIRAQLVEFEENDKDQAFRQYQAIARQVESGAVMLDVSELYYRMAVLMGDQMNANKKEDRDILLTVLEKGLAADQNDENCLAYKAWLLRKDGRMADAIEMYRSLNTPAAQMKLAELYYNDLNHYAREAMECYESLLQKRQTPELCFYAAACRRHLGDYDAARRYYLQEIALDPMDVDGYNGLATVCEAQGRLDEALDWIKKAVAIMWETENLYDWLIEHQAQILRRMGRPREAMAAVDDAMERSDYPGGWQLKFDICCQFGLFDQAKQIIDRWKQADRQDPAPDKAAGRLHLLSGKLFMAALAMGRIKHKLEYEDEQDFRLQLAELEGNQKRAAQIWARRAAQDPVSDHACMSLALAQWWSGDRKAAMDNARRALEMIDESLQQHLVDEALLRSRRSVLLALLGDTEGAREELARVRKLPLCQFCAYGRCKDADIFEGYIEEIAGNTGKARAIYSEGRKNWPDELDFATGEVRLKKKGK